MNLVLEIRLLGKTIMDNLTLEILRAPRLLLPLYDAPTGPCKKIRLAPSDPFHLIQNS